MFSKKDKGNDLFRNSVIDTSNPDKIIIREKEAPKKKVRRRVKKGTRDALLAKKQALKSADKIRITDAKPAANAKSRIEEAYKIPRLSEIEKQKDDFDYDTDIKDISSQFRKSSADWRDETLSDYSGLDNLSGNSFPDSLFNWFRKATVLQWTALVLAVVLFISGIMTTNVYAKLQCETERQSAYARLSSYEEETFNEVAKVVEDVEAPLAFDDAKPNLSKVLTLVLSSVEKDLKIKLVDEDDTLVKNIPWSVNVEDSDGNTSEEEDDDEDGIIHMTEVPAGDYSVTLNSSDALKDFELPTGAQTVSVKAKVEYKVIVDIKEEIKSEKEVNAAAEDVAGNQAADVESSTKPADTVEWLESTKELIGEEYVEATPDITKTASIQKTGTLKAVIDKIMTKAKRSFGGTTFAYPLFLTGDVTTTQNEQSTQDGSHTHTFDNWTQDGDGQHKGTCTVDGCSETKTESCTYTDGKCTKCGREEPVAQTPTHTCHLEYENTNDATNHTVKCTVADCDKGYPKSEAHDFNSNNTCTKCGYQKAVDHNLTYTSNNNGTHNVACSVSGCSSGHNKNNVSCEYDTNGSCKYCKYVKPEATKYKVTVSSGCYGAGTYAAGDNVIIEATVPTGQKFDKWEASGISLSSAQTTTYKITFTMPSNDVSLTAKFTAEQKYSDDAQLYDASMNALYVKEGDSYRLAKYKDYKDNPNQTFYRKQEKYKYTGWQTIDGKRYYFDRNNEPVTGKQIIGGVEYDFGQEGASSPSSGVLGIDVSKYQPSINWQSVKASGVSYVIIRCGYRGSSTGALIEDPYFKSHIKGAKAAGLKVGIYFFTTAVTEAEAVEEASMAAYLCKGYGIDYPIFMDCESSPRPGYNSLSSGQRTAIIKAFCNTIRSAGYTPGVYANKTWLTSYMNAGELSGYKIWLAQYNTAPTYSGRYDMWQYTSKGQVNGISGYVDMNQSYMAY